MNDGPDGWRSAAASLLATIVSLPLMGALTGLALGLAGPGPPDLSLALVGAFVGLIMAPIALPASTMLAALLYFAVGRYAARRTAGRRRLAWMGAGAAAGALVAAAMIVEIDLRSGFPGTDPAMLPWIVGPGILTGAIGMLLWRAVAYLEM